MRFKVLALSTMMLVLLSAPFALAEKGGRKYRGYDRGYDRGYSQNRGRYSLPPGLARKGYLPPGLHRQYMRGHVPPGLYRRAVAYPVYAQPVYYEPVVPVVEPVVVPVVHPHYYAPYPRSRARVSIHLQF